MAACGHIPILKAPAPQGSFSGTFTMSVVSCHLCISSLCDLSFLCYQSSVVSRESQAASVVSCQLSAVNMSWGGHKNNHSRSRGDEAIGSFKRQRRNAADAGSDAAAGSNAAGDRYQLPSSIELYIYAWGAEFKYGGKGGSALACFFGITFTIVDLESHCWNHIHNHLLESQAARKGEPSCLGS